MVRRLKSRAQLPRRAATRKKAAPKRLAATKRAPTKAAPRRPAPTKRAPTKPAPRRAPPPKRARAGYSPFTLLKSDDGQYSLVLSELDSPSPAFEATGQRAGGQEWAAVANSLVAGRPELKEGVHLDADASMFRAWGDDKKALEALAALLEDAWWNADVLRKAIEAADFDEPP